jgi:hypothetical protein
MALDEVKKDVKSTKETLELRALLSTFVNEMWHKINNDENKKRAVLSVLEMDFQVKNVDQKLVDILKNIIFRLKNDRWAKSRN